MTPPSTRQVWQRTVETQRLLDLRKQQILEIVVTDYTKTRLPVGSQLVAEQLVAWSSATIRNELANLVDEGYLLQPHSSSGRLPSDQGYRYYVNYLMEEEVVPLDVALQIDAFFPRQSRNFEELIENAAMALATATDAVAIIASPQATAVRIKHLDLMELDRFRALLIVVLEGNIVRERTINIGDQATQEQLTFLAHELNVQLKGYSVADLEEMVPVNEIANESTTGIRAAVIGEVRTFLRELDSERGHWVIHDGVRNLLKQPEFDLVQLEQVMEVLEEEKIISELIATIDSDVRENPGVRIIIGRENEVTQLTHCSLVFTAYRIDTHRYGTMGILGPTRMVYAQVAPRVRYIAQCVEKCLNEMMG